MPTSNKVFEDFQQLFTNAMGVAQGAKTEAETAMKSWMDRWLADRDFVTREEFDAVRAMAQELPDQALDGAVAQIAVDNHLAVVDIGPAALVPVKIGCTLGQRFNANGGRRARRVAGILIGFKFILVIGPDDVLVRRG